MDHGLLLEIRHKEAIEIVKYQPLFIGIVNGRHDRPDGQVQIGVQLLRVHGIGGYVGHRLRLWFRVRRGRFALLRRLRCSCRQFRLDWFSLGLRIKAQAGRQRQAYQNTARHGNRRLSPKAHDMRNSAPNLPFSKGRRYAERALRTGGAPQQRFGVGRPDVRRALPQHRLVTGALHILTGQPKGQPDKRINPVETERRRAEELPKRIAPADVLPLMGENMRPFRLV